MVSSFYGKDVISAAELKRDSLESLFDAADFIRNSLAKKRMLDILEGYLLATVFMEPSTRTRLSFQFAMVKVGGSVIDFGPAEAASIAKGETFEDTLRMIDGYRPDAVAVRAKAVGSARQAADICEAPVINAGDGSNEHPTQAMLDLYTIRRIRHEIDGVSIGVMGDVAHSRTTSSLSMALDKYDRVKIFYIAPEELQVRQETLDSLHNATYQKTDDLQRVFSQLDFLYVTRLQKERFANPDDYQRLKGSYQLNKAFLISHQKVPYILHPLPRVDELGPDVDSLPAAKYFEQAKNGLYLRAALLAQILIKDAPG
ncbi:MAG: aspartate carbamoyltransferase [Nitrososphaerota archaeon]|nr:aspartate carbamoyltransferase [Nitrososphaerota archaeon]